MNLVAIQDLRYAQKDLKSGDPFDASENDAKVLKAAGKARESETDRGLFERKDEQAAGDSATTQTGRGRYKRRDMRAGE